MFNKLKSGHWPIFLLNSISSLGNLFLPIILVRLLTPEDVGVYKIFFLHYSALPFIFMAGGALHSVFYWVGRKGEERERYLNATWVVTLVLSSLIFLVGYPLKPVIAQYLDLPKDYIFILLLSGVMTCTGSHFAETNFAYGKMTGTFVETIVEFFRVTGFIFIAWYYKDISLLFSFFLIHMTLRFVLMTILNKKINNVGLKTGQDEIKSVLKYSMPMAFSGLLAFFVEKLDLLILSSHLSASDFAFYSMGCLIVPPLYILEMTVQKALIPSLSKNYLSKDFKACGASFRKAIKDISFLIIPSVFGLIIFTKPIVEILYTSQYLESVIYLKVFAFSYLLLMLPHDSVARATGKTDWILKIYLLITPLLLVGAYIAAKYYGAVGVLVITLLLRFIPKYYGFNLSKNIMHWSWKQMFPIRHIILFTITCSILTVLSLLAESFFETSTFWFLICGPLFAILYLGTIYTLGNRGRYAEA